MGRSGARIAVLAVRAGLDELDVVVREPPEELLGALQFTRFVGVIQDQRMQVAISRVEDIGHLQTVFLGHLADLL